MWKRDIVMRYRPSPSSSTASTARGVPAPPFTTSATSPSAALMRTASMNKMMMTTSKAYSQSGGGGGGGSSSTIHSDKFEAIVPHLGAHLAELTSIADGNTDYLPDRPYLFNTHKLALLAGTLSLLLKMQRLSYNLTPVRCISAALNFTAKRELKLSAAAASAFAAQMYTLSNAVEPEGGGAGENHSFSSTSGPHQKGKLAISTPGSPAGKGKIRKSLAYERITKSGKHFNPSGEEEGSEEEDEESGEEDEDEEEEEVSPKPKVLRPAKLVRKLTSVFFSSGKK